MGIKSDKVVFKDSDPLFGVLTEHQVGFNPFTGKTKISHEILQGLRQYLLMASGPERLSREAKVKSAIVDLEENPLNISKY